MSQWQSSDRESFIRIQVFATAKQNRRKFLYKERIDNKAPITSLQKSMFKSVGSWVRG